MTQKNCRACGASLESAAKFCPQCGTSLSGKTPTSSGKSARGMSTRDSLMVVGVLVVFAIIFFIVKSPTEIPAPARPQSTAEVPGGHEGMLPPEILETLPTDYANLVDLGNHYMDQGNLVMATEIYSRALAIDGGSGNVRTDYGACLHGMGLPHRAIEEFRKVMETDPTHGISRFNMGIVYRGLDELDSARVYWQAYLAMDPNGSAAAEARRLLTEIGG